MIYLYIGHLDHLLKIFSKNTQKNGKNEICCIRKSHINKYEKMRKITNMQILVHTYHKQI